MVNEMRMIVSLIVIWITTLFANAFGQTLVFPHLTDGNIGDGSRWSTELDLVNTSSSEQTARVSFFNPDGTPKLVVFPRDTGLGTLSSVTFTFAPEQLRVVQIDSGFQSDHPLQTGWVLVEGSIGIKGLIIFRRIERPFVGKILSEVAFQPHSPVSKIDFIPQIPTLASGGESAAENVPMVAYALVNPDPLVTAVGDIHLFDASNQQLIATSSFTLPPRGQLAEYIEQRFGGSSISGNRLYVRVVVNTGKVSGIALRVVGTSIASIAIN